MNQRVIWGRPYRTTTIPSAREQVNKLANITRRTPSANTSFSVHRDPQKKMQMNQQLLEQRRENYLNSQFNKRRSTLKQITKDNKKIYERINSQKSLYSQDKMNKSTDSLRSLSRCSSRSRSSKGKGGVNQKNLKNKTSKTTNNITIESQSIKNVQGSNLLQFQSIFKPNSTQQENCRFLPNRPIQSLSLRKNPVQSKPIQMGSMLHRIAEEMLAPKPKTRQSGRRKLLY